jgi:hypothetical protein
MPSYGNPCPVAGAPPKPGKLRRDVDNGGKFLMVDEVGKYLRDGFSGLGKKNEGWLPPGVSGASETRIGGRVSSIGL